MPSPTQTRLPSQLSFKIFLAACVFFASSAQSDLGKTKLGKIADMTCLEMVETRNFESAKRVRLVNEFRINADLELFTEGDEKLVQYLKAGLCRTVLLQSETELKLALERLDANLEQQKQDAAKVLMDAAFKKYETEIAACTPPAEKVDIFGRRVGDTMTLGLGWNRNYKSCLLGYRASYKLGREKALAQRTLYYLVELEKIETPLLFSGEYQSWLGADRCSNDFCLIGFGYRFTTGYAGFGTSMQDPTKMLGKKLKKKDIKKITLVLAGDINGYASDVSLGINQRMDPFPDGKKISKVVYQKN